MNTPTNYKDYVMKKTTNTFLLTCSFALIALIAAYILYMPAGAQPNAPGMADHCYDILAHGVFDSYASNSQSDFESKISKAFAMSYDALKTSRNDGSLSVEIPIPLADSLLNLGVDGSTSSSTYESLRQSYNSSTTDSARTSIINNIVRQVANPRIVSAWQDCMHTYGQAKAPDGLDTKLTVVGGKAFPEVNDAFSVSFSYSAARAGYANPVSCLVSVTGAKPFGRSVFKDGSTVSLKLGQSLTQQFKRTGRGGVYVLLSPNINPPVETGVMLPQLNAAAATNAWPFQGEWKGTATWTGGTAVADIVVYIGSSKPNSSGRVTVVFEHHLRIDPNNPAAHEDDVMHDPYHKIQSVTVQDDWILSGMKLVRSTPASPTLPYSTFQAMWVDGKALKGNTLIRDVNGERTAQTMACVKP